MLYNEDDFVELLKNKGLKVTNQRKIILEGLASQPDEHFTAEEIYEMVKEKYPEIGLATVYRTIQLFSDLELIESLNLDDGYVRYEIVKSNSKHHHHHLICLGCGRVFSFEGDLLDHLERQINETLGFRVENHEVKLYGYCKNCTEDSEKTIPTE